MAKLRNGFSMIEVIFSVFVISIGLTGTTALLNDSMRESISSRDSVIASQLAQEGIELVRNLRDNNWENERGSFATAYFPSGDKSNCKIDYNDTDMQNSNCIADNDFQLYLSGGLYYQHTSIGATATKYFRKIKIDYDPDVSPTKAIVTSFVKWDGTMPVEIDTIAECVLTDECVYAEDILTKWGE